MVRARANRIGGLIAESIGHLIGCAILIGAAVYPLVLAFQSGLWWTEMIACALVAAAAIIFLYVAFVDY